MAEGIRAVIGPVPATAARVWIANTRKIVDAVRTQPEKIPFRVPDDVGDAFAEYLDRWWQEAQDEEFHWSGEEDPERLRMLLTYWVNIDRLTDAQMADLGVTWSPPAGEPFFQAVTAAVIAALVSNDELADFGETLRVLWS